MSKYYHLATAEEEKIDADPYAPTYYYPQILQTTNSFSSSTASSPSPPRGILAYIDDYFEITDRGSSIMIEIRAGVVTFATMAYILIVNATILSKAHTGNGAHMAFDSIITATALSAAIGSGLAGIWAGLPIGLAAGMGLNSYFTYGIVVKLNLDWPIALTAVFIHGILFILLSLCGACNLIQVFAPPAIKKSITVGLGLFQALIGFEQMKLVVQGSDVLLTIGDVRNPHLWLSILGLFLIALLLVSKVKAAMLIGMFIITLIAWTTGMESTPTGIIELPSMGNTFFHLDFSGYFANFSATVPATLMFLFVSIFDTAGVQLMAGAQAGLLDENGHLPGSKAAFLSAGIATVFGALFGTSPIIIHTESCAGIACGAKTGLHSVVVAALFLLALPFMPILNAVPTFVTSPALVIVGMYMMSAAKFIDWERIDEALPAFLCATILPLTYSIANGVVAGLTAFIILKIGAYLSGELDKPILLSPTIEEGATIVSTGDEDNDNITHSASSDNVRPPILRTASGLRATEDPAPGSPVPYMVDRTQMMNSAQHHNPQRRLSHQLSGRSLLNKSIEHQEYGAIDNNSNIGRSEASAF